MRDAGLREAVDGDSGAVIRLVRRVFEEFPGCVLDVEGEEPELLAPASSFPRFWVLERRGEVVACGGLVVREEEEGGVWVEAKKIYVDRSARRRGAGRRLMAEVERHAAEIGAAGVELWSDTRFRQAHAFYESLGYRRTGRSRRLLDLSDTTEIHYRKLLSPRGTL